MSTIVSMATKICRVVTYHEGLSTIKSHDPFNHVVFWDLVTN